MKNEEQKPIDNIVKETYDEIMDRKECKDKTRNEVTDLDVEQQNEILNPDPDSLDSRG